MRNKESISESVTHARRRLQAPVRRVKQWAIYTTQTASSAARADEHLEEKLSTTFTDAFIARRIIW